MRKMAVCAAMLVLIWPLAGFGVELRAGVQTLPSTVRVRSTDTVQGTWVREPEALPRLRARLAEEIVNRSP